jgi:hypothetical protein
MKHVWLRAQYGVERRRRARLLLFKRYRLHSHGKQTCHQKCCAESLAIDLSVYLLRRLFNSKLFEQSRKLLVTDASFEHLELNQLLCSVLPHPIGLSTVISQSVHHIPTDFQLQSPIPVRRPFATILGRIRLVVNRHPYTPSESYFCEDLLLANFSSNPFGIKLPVSMPTPGDAR